MNTLTDPRKLKLLYSKHKFTVLAWTTLAIAILFVYHLASDGDFSFLLTLGGIVNCFAFAILLVKMRDQKNASGVSLKTLEVYVLVFIFRLCSVLFFEGYLPFDKSGDWLYQGIEIVSLVLVCTLVFHVLSVYKSSYEEKEDAFGNLRVPREFGIVYLVVPCIILAVLFHPNLNDNWFSDTAWSLASSLEMVAIIPQLYMFQKKGGEVEAFTSNFCAALVVGRMFHFVFWISSYHELNSHNVRFAGPYVLLTQVAQLLLMADYFYYYVKSVRSGGPMRLPTANSMV